PTMLTPALDLLSTPCTLLAAAKMDPLGHVIDHPHVGTDNLWFISNVTIMLVLAGLLCMALLIPAARRIAKGQTGTWEDYVTKGTRANFVEVICVYLRDQTFKPVLAEDTDKYTPTLWTFFWFIL